MRDRRKELRPTTRLQVLSVAGGLSGLPAAELERTLMALYVSQPLRWQTFMDEAQVLFDAVNEDHSGFAGNDRPGRKLARRRKNSFSGAAVDKVVHKLSASR